MAVNRGKDFEAAFKNALCKIQNISVDRLPDPAAGYAGVRNICDFCVYLKPNQFFFECKAIRGNTLNFKSHITKDQWEGLLEKSKIDGVCAGICVWFIDHDVTVFVPIQQLEALKQQFNKKSLHVSDLDNTNLEKVELIGKKKRIMFDYDGARLLQDLRNMELFHD